MSEEVPTRLGEEEATAFLSCLIVLAEDDFLIGCFLSKFRVIPDIHNVYLI
jgi:hypothetical protein